MSFSHGRDREVMVKAEERPMTEAQKRLWENCGYLGNSRWAQMERYMVAMGTLYAEQVSVMRNIRINSEDVC